MALAGARADAGLDRCHLLITKTRGHFPTDDALIKLLYLGCREMGRTTTAGRGGRSNYNWKIALNQFDAMFPGRLDNA